MPIFSTDPLKLCHAGRDRWSTAIFRSLRRCSFGFKLGHSGTFTQFFLRLSCFVLAVCLGHCPVRSEPSAQSEVPSALDQVFIEDLFLLCSIQLPINHDQSPCLCCWKAHPQHDAANTMLHHWEGIGQVMSDNCFLQTWSQNWNQKVLSWFHQWGEASFWPLSHKAQIGGVL